MKIKVIIPAISNLYSFISNLSQWNELLCIPQRKKEWLKKIGKLNEREKKALIEFSHILQKAKVNLEPVFLFSNYKEVWRSLSKKISKAEVVKIQSIFKILKDRFEKIWKIENKKLMLIAKEFKNKNFQIHSNLEIIKKLCGLKKEQLPQKIEVRLLLSSHQKEDCQGWSNNGKIALECSGWPIKKANYLINNIFLHECFHILLKRNKQLFSDFKHLINKNSYLLKNSKLKVWTPAIVFEEALISSFLPEGYLAEKNHQINVKKTAQRELIKKNDSLTKLRYYCAIQLYKLAKQYVIQQKSLDIEFLNHIVKCIKSFMLNKKGRGHIPTLD